jgi:hypothetical protein
VAHTPFLQPPLEALEYLDQRPYSEQHYPVHKHQAGERFWTQASFEIVVIVGAHSRRQIITV